MVNFLGYNLMVVKLFVIQAVNVIECKIEVIFGLQQSFFSSFDDDSVSYYLNDEMASQISVKIGSDNGLLPDSIMSSAASQIQTDTCLCLQEFPIFNGLMNVSSFTCSLYPPLQRSWMGVYWFHLVRLWTESCPLCIFNNTHWIQFIFAHLIKQLQKRCRV